MMSSRVRKALAGVSELRGVSVRSVQLSAASSAAAPSGSARRPAPPSDVGVEEGLLIRCPMSG